MPKPPKAVMNDAMVVGFRRRKTRHVMGIEASLRMALRATSRIGVNVVTAEDLTHQRADDREKQSDAETDEVNEKKVHKFSGVIARQLKATHQD